MKISEIEKYRVLVGKPGALTEWGKCEHNTTTDYGDGKWESASHFNYGCFVIDDSSGKPVLVWKDHQGNPIRSYSLEQNDGSFKIFIEIQVEPNDPLLSYQKSGPRGRPNR